jgi:hypothetical protein
MKKTFLFTLLPALIIFANCSKPKQTIDLNYGKEYLPIATGKYIEYSCDSTLYNNYVGATFYHKYFIKDIIDSSFLDLTNDTTYFVTRFIKRADTIDEYKFQKLFYITKKNDQMQMVEDNMRIIKMTFPMAYNKRWNGNVFTAIGNDNAWMEDWLGFKYQEIGKPFKTDSLSFENTVTVFQQNNMLEPSTVPNDTSVHNVDYGEFTFSTEVYAKGVGLIEKRFVHYTSGTANGGGNATAIEKMRKGFGVVLKAINHN